LADGTGRLSETEHGVDACAFMDFMSIDFR